MLLKQGEMNTWYYVNNDVMLSMIFESLTSIGHGGRTLILEVLQVKYKNIWEFIYLFVTLLKIVSKVCVNYSIAPLNPMIFVLIFYTLSLI